MPCCWFVLFILIRHVFLSTVRVPVKSTVIPGWLKIADKRDISSSILSNEALQHFSC